LEDITSAWVHWYNTARLMHRLGRRPPAEAEAEYMSRAYWAHLIFTGQSAQIFWAARRLIGLNQNSGSMPLEGWHMPSSRSSGLTVVVGGAR
jgi:hypothetical protein